MTLVHCGREVEWHQCSYQTDHLLNGCTKRTINSNQQFPDSNHPFLAKSSFLPKKRILSRKPPKTVPSLNMAFPQDWQFMEMNDPELIQGRPAVMNVFMPFQTELDPTNAFLDRTTFILAGPHANLPNLGFRVTCALAAIFGIPRQALTVRASDLNFGDLIVIFPLQEMRNQACSMGILSLGVIIEVQILTWSFDRGLVYDPTAHRVRIRIEGVPYQHWNSPHIHYILSGFGYSVVIAPFFANGNFEFIRALVACTNLEEVPQSLKLVTEPNGGIIMITMEGWLPAEQASGQWLIPPQDDQELPHPDSPHNPDDDQQGDQQSDQQSDGADAADSSSSDGDDFDDHPPKRRAVGRSGSQLSSLGEKISDVRCLRQIISIHKSVL